MSEYQFSEDWFSGQIPAWSRILAAGTPKVLEIGSFEGRSAVWLIEHALTDKGELYCVDPWSGPEHLARFNANIKVAQLGKPGVNVIALRGLSEVELPHLLAAGHADTFDFIYVDGNHDAVNALTDLCLAFLLCKPGCLICVDDYNWPDRIHPLRKPKISVDAFTTIFCERLRIVHQDYQVWVRKLRQDEIVES